MDPITPQQLKDSKPPIPEKVIEVVNKLLTKHAGSNTSRIKILQKDIVAELLDTYSKDRIFSKKMLDFERLYEQFGWSVTYDKPAYCETYEPYFIFVPKN